MRRILATAAALIISFAAFALSPEIRDVQISVSLHKDGSASINEKWDVTVVEGTEWYLVRDNLGDIDITGLNVTDESGVSFENIGEWEVDRSLKQKKWKCGIVHKSKSGMELCWGLGSMGDHIYTVNYKMSNVVKSLNDYDSFHIQLLSPGLSSRPLHVKVEISSDQAQLDTNQVRAWGFGFDGDVRFSDGKVVLESSSPIRTNSGGSVIALLRFDKGIFASPSNKSIDFQDQLDVALEGASFDDDDDDKEAILFLMKVLFAIIVLIIIGVLRYSHVSKKDKIKVLGIDPKDVQWQRDIPFDSDIVASDYVLSRLGEKRKGNSLSSALILQMVYKGNLSVNKDARGKVEFSFNNDHDLDSTSKGLYDMMLKASGKDQVLQDREFSRWSKSHSTTINNWYNHIKLYGSQILQDKLLMEGRKFNFDGQKQARDLMGLKLFLSDYTLIKEKATVEVHLWREYLVFGALFGIAELVAKQLKDIDPRAFESAMQYDYDTLTGVIIRTQLLSRAITNAHEAASYGGGSSRGGFGGGASFGGGGGFSGGGFGGGCR